MMTQTKTVRVPLITDGKGAINRAIVGIEELLAAMQKVKELPVLFCRQRRDALSYIAGMEDTHLAVDVANREIVMHTILMTWEPTHGKEIVL
jgi:hypothetical protein